MNALETNRKWRIFLNQFISTQNKDCMPMAVFNQIADHLRVFPFGNFVLSNRCLREHQLQSLTMDCAKREVTCSAKTHPELKRACRVKGSASLALVKSFISSEELSKGYIDAIVFPAAH